MLGILFAGRRMRLPDGRSATAGRTSVAVRNALASERGQPTPAVVADRDAGPAGPTAPGSSPSWRTSARLAPGRAGHARSRTASPPISGCCCSGLEECWWNGSHLNSRPDRWSSGSTTARTGWTSLRRGARPHGEAGAPTGTMPGVPPTPACSQQCASFTRAVGDEDVRHGQPAVTAKIAVRSPEHGDRHPAWKRILSSLTCCD